MKRSRCISAIMMLLLVFACVVMCAGSVKASGKGKEITIVFTHDLHSHVEEFETLQDGKYITTGGFARIVTEINRVKNTNDQVLVVDGGDYSMGTLYQSLYTSDSVELSLLASMGYDAVTIGNHEFDYGEEGLSDSLKVAAKNTNRPAMVLSNVNWDESGDRGRVVKEGFDEYKGSAYTIINKGDIKVAVFGIFGKDALDCVNNCPLVFDDCVESAKKIVEEIKTKENPDIIVCLSHSGVSSNQSKSEDEILAKKVPDIDVIVSGHTHTTISEPITKGDTYIVGCGCYGMDLGELTLSQNDNGRWTLNNYTLKNIDSSVCEDETIKSEIEKYTKSIDEKYLSSFGLTKKQIIAYNDVDFEDADTVYTQHRELKLGNIMSDAFANIGRKYAGLTDDVVVGIVPAGYIRDTYVRGEINVDDVFNSYSLGIGADNTVGYPLVCVYLTGSELKTAAEVDASLSGVVTGVSLFCSGMNFSFNEHRIVLNKVTDVSLVNKEGQTVEIEKNKLYPVIVDLGTAESLGRIKKSSYGLISINPKDKDGNSITDMKDAIIYDGNKELKAWDSIRQYMQTFDKDSNGVAHIPDKYNQYEGRKNNNTNWNLWDIVRNPNIYGIAIVLIVILIIVILILLVRLIVKMVKKHIIK